MGSYGRHCCGDLGRVQDRCLLLGDQQGPVGRGVQDCCGKPRSFLLLAPRWIPSPCHVRSSRFLFSLFPLPHPVPSRANLYKDETESQVVGFRF